MDVAMSICSAVAEIHQNGWTSRLAWRSCLPQDEYQEETHGNHGEHALILAVAGTSLNMMLMIYSYDVEPAGDEYGLCGDQIIQCIAGSVGIVLRSRWVALLSAAYSWKKTKK